MDDLVELAVDSLPRALHNQAIEIASMPLACLRIFWKLCIRDIPYQLVNREAIVALLIDEAANNKRFEDTVNVALVRFCYSNYGGATKVGRLWSKGTQCDKYVARLYVERAT